jgi:hypothetical protein
MALTTQNAAGLVAQGQAAPEARVKVRLLRAIRHLGEHVAAGEVLEVPRAQAVELRGMQKAEILPEGVAGADKAAPKKTPAARRGVAPVSATPATEEAPK